MRILTLTLEIISGLVLIIFSLRISSLVITLFSITTGSAIGLYLALIPLLWVVGIVLIVLGMRNLSKAQKK